jgi:hypothetical protein
LQLAFPTETTAKVLGRAAPIVVGDDAVKTGVIATLARATSDAMRAAGTAFDIGTSHIDTYLADHAEVLAGVAEPVRANVVSTLKRTQRLFRVSTGADSLDWLMNNGYNSASQIAAVPRQTFVRQAAGALGEAQASILHNRARTVGDAALTTYVQLHDAMFGIYPAAVLNGEDRIVAGKAIGAAVATFAPTWQTLFNEGAVCDCTHCRSVYSPAAYLVDVLNFLDLSEKTSGLTPLDVLLTRRPDIAGIKLTCENTDTLIP